MRTDQEIVEQTNEIARQMYLIRGYQIPSKHKFYEFDRLNFHPHERECWDMACIAQEILTGTDPNDALSNLCE